MKELYFIKQQSSLIAIDINKILFIKAIKDKSTIIFNDNKEYSIHSSLKEIQSKLPKNFYRIHNSTIVNTDMINKIEDNQIYFQNSKFVTISRYNVHGFKKHLQIL